MKKTETPRTAPGVGPSQLLVSLEPDQLTSARRQRVPRRYLGPPQVLLLWSLRLYLLFMLAVVIYQVWTGM